MSFCLVPDMGRKSSIEVLPQDIVDKLHDLLRDPRINQMDATAKINAVLAEQGHEDRVSKSAVNRYAQRMEQVGKKLRESREIAKIWIGKLGSEPQGETGKLINEMIRTMVFELVFKLQQENIDVDDAPELAKMIKNLTEGVERLERAATVNHDRDEKIRHKARQEAAEKAAKIAKKGGMSQSTVDEIKAGILGVNRG